MESPASASPENAGQIVSLCFFRFAGIADRAWAFGQMGLARRPLRRLVGAGFVKLMGAGTGEGFTPVPDPGVAVVLTTWPDLGTAQAQTLNAQVFRRYRDRAREAFVLHLQPTSSRGRWAGQAPFRPGLAGGACEVGPVAVLTRASVRPRHLLRFWRRAPAISARIGSNPDVLFKAGVGEVPWLHQMTFSVWPDTAAMAAFARADGPHASAIRSVRAEGWFSEELYARFTVAAHSGSWGGIDPLARRPAALAGE